MTFFLTAVWRSGRPPPVSYTHLYTAEGNGAELEDLYDQVEAEVAYGGTDI